MSTVPTLESIEAALTAATPGPWEASTSEATMNDRNEWRICQEAPPSRPSHLRAVMSSADAHLIANAPAWLAYLVQRVKAAEAYSDIDTQTAVDMANRAFAAEAAVGRVRAFAEKLKASGIVSIYESAQEFGEMIADALEPQA